jgi:hypothetical protein
MLQVQSELDICEFALAGQLVHEVLPVVFLYVPAMQLVHTNPSGPENPMLQVQLRNAVHALHEAPEFDGQDVHSADPVVLLYIAV